MAMNNARIKIYKTAETRVNGKPIASQELFYECWCKILQLYGKELYEAVNIKLEHTLVFKVRYCKKLKDILNKECFTVEYNGNLFKIYYSDFTRYPNKYVLLKCNLFK